MLHARALRLVARPGRISCLPITVTRPLTSTISNAAAAQPGKGAFQSRDLSSASGAPPMDSAHLREVHELSGEALFLMSAYPGVHLEASRERMLREVQLVDGISHEEAKVVVRKMASKNTENLFYGLLPYRVGIVTAVSAAWLSIPAVFSKSFAIAFNEKFVTTEVPHAEDMETMLEIGSWSWNWMEPPLGTISFFLLCLQYARDQRINIGWKPWTEHWKSTQADKLAAAYPQCAARHPVPATASARTASTFSAAALFFWRIALHHTTSASTTSSRRRRRRRCGLHGHRTLHCTLVSHRYNRSIVRDYAKVTCFEDDSDDF